MSRLTFAERFAALVGEPPLSYLERWRLDLTAHLLRTEMIALDALAARVGYASAASLSRAFKRRFREAPGAYRRQAIRTPGHSRGPPGNAPPRPVGYAALDGNTTVQQGA